jgi:hypothetical protein
VNIEWAVPCRYAESDGMMATMVGAGIDVTFHAQYPAAVGLMVAVRLAAPPEELAPGQIHMLRCRVLDADNEPVTAPDGSQVPELEVGIGSQVPVQQLVQGWLVQPLVAFGLQWWVTEPQTYTIAISVDGADPHLSPHHVVRPPQIGPTPE